MRINVTGCCLIDYIHDNVRYGSANFSRYLSRNEGDGGITPGKLVFEDVFRTFSGESPAEALPRMTGTGSSAMVNLGGPAVVAAVHASQVLDPDTCHVSFYGGHGRDEAGKLIAGFLQKTPVRYEHTELPGNTPVTYVFSDPTWNGGNGERAFLGVLGTSALYEPKHLGGGFFEADINVWGGTALVPGLHSRLSSLLKKGRASGAIQVVTTVYDFINQRKSENALWPMGDGDEAYRFIDLLICDQEEALRLSGTGDPRAAVSRFIDMGAGAVVITRGHRDVVFASSGSRFVSSGIRQMPVSAYAIKRLRDSPESAGDTTGCGDNFAGGVIAGLALQMVGGNADLDLRQALGHGIAAGGFACFYVGGTWIEREPGEKKRAIEPYYNR